MTDNVSFAQDLIDKHADIMLNYIRALPLTENLIMTIELELKQLVMNVASDVMNSTKDTCLKIFAENVKK